MSLTDNQRLYQCHLKAAEELGQPLTEYARDHDVNLQSLYGERSRLRKKEKAASSTFVRVQDISSEPVATMAMLQIRLPNGVSLAVPTHQVPLTEILQTLARL